MRVEARGTLWLLLLSLLDMSERHIEINFKGLVGGFWSAGPGIGAYFLYEFDKGLGYCFSYALGIPIVHCRSAVS